MNNKLPYINDYIPEPKLSDIENTVSAGQRYISVVRPRKTPLMRLFFAQIRYLSPALWVTQLVGLLFVGYMCIGTELVTQRGGLTMMMLAVPLVAMMNVPELVKDTLCNMSELERSTKIGSGTILLLRLGAVNCANLAVLLIAALTASLAGSLSFVTLLLFTVAVYNIVNILCLAIIRLFKIRGRNGAMCVSTTVMFITMSMSVILPYDFTEMLIKNTLLLIVMLAVSVAVFAAQITVMLKRMPLGGLLNED
ncbi:MAG: hypothetical protein J1E39_09660 [Eubacterium sp.]|nr:hypothetical protein [Eubacterium sp.]